MKYSITGNKLADYAVIPGAIIGFVHFLAYYVGPLGARFVGTESFIYPQLAWLGGLVAAVLLAYFRRSGEKNALAIVAGGGFLGFSAVLVSGILNIAFIDARGMAVDFGLFAVVNIVNYSLAACAGMALWIALNRRERKAGSR